MIELDTRQQATLIWFVVVILGLVLWPKTRGELFPAIKNALQVMATWKIIVPFVVYFIYATVLIYIAQRLGVWNVSLLTDTLIIIFFVGIPMFVNANIERRGTEMLTKTLRETIGVSAIIAFYIGLEPLTLLGELILQPVVTVVSILALVAGYDAKTSSVRNVMKAVLTIIGLWLMIRTVRIIIETWHVNDVESSLSELLLSILLPLALLPAVYVFALIMRYEIIFRVAKNFSENKHVPNFAYVTILTNLNVQLSPLNELGGIWLQKVVQSANYKEVCEVLSDLKKAIRTQRRGIKERNRRLRAMKGKTGVDKAGLQLDRREFYEAKEDLESLLYTQRAQFNVRRHKFNPDLPIQLGFSKLPKDHGITMIVSKDRKSWYAWRRMPNGYYLGVGGSSKSNHSVMWLYEALSRPNGFPSKSSSGWTEYVSDVKPPEWQFDDTPPRIKVPEAYLDT